MGVLFAKGSQTKAPTRCILYEGFFNTCTLCGYLKWVYSLRRNLRQVYPLWRSEAGVLLAKESQTGVSFVEISSGYTLYGGSSVCHDQRHAFPPCKVNAPSPRTTKYALDRARVCPRGGARKPLSPR